MQETEDFIETYLQYTKKTECPTLFNRWTALTSLGAFLGRSICFHHGHFKIHPNLYVMLIGSPGTKKSSAIKIGSKIIQQAGYNNFAAKKTRQEKYLLDLAEAAEELYVNSTEGAQYEMDSILDQNLFGRSSKDAANAYMDRPPAESFIAADEFNNFLGVGNLDFASILGELWDYDGVYDYRLKNSKSIYIPFPTVSILGGNTQTNLATAFPPEAIGQGFFSRLLLVYGEPSGVLYTFPPPPDLVLQGKLLAKLSEIKEGVRGEAVMTDDALDLLDKIYKSGLSIDDARFEHYKNRRLTHLIKLCMIVAAARVSVVIEAKDVIKANTYLTAAEQLMPKALGEFGKAKHSAVTHRVMTAIEAADMPVTFQALWKEVHSDLDNRQQLQEIIASLVLADKVQSLEHGYLPKKSIRRAGVDGAVDYSLLTKEERELL